MRIAVIVVIHLLRTHHCYLRSADTYEMRTSLNSVSFPRHILDLNGADQF